MMTSRCRTASLTGRLAVAIALILAAGPASGQKFPEPVLALLKDALGAYEKVRGELASDQMEGVSGGAAQLSVSLRSALRDGGLQGEIPGVIEEAVFVAESLEKVGDLDSARAEFGEMSRLFMRLAGNDSRLAEGRHVFACPMVKTFPKWIQPREDLENPYMGLSMPACGFATDWSIPRETPALVAPSSAPDAGLAGEESGSEPVFKPGIPGAKMVDYRDHRFLWREIEELQAWQRGQRISVAEFRSKSIEKTAHFLGFGGPEADKFATMAAKSVESLRQAFNRMKENGENPGGLNTSFSHALEQEVERVTSFLGDEPRHQVFAPGCKKWLLKLAFGPREAAEAENTRASK